MRRKSLRLITSSKIVFPVFNFRSVDVNVPTSNWARRLDNYFRLHGYIDD